MQPALAHEEDSLVLKLGGTQKPVNSEEWWRGQTSKIAPEEVFFHKYFVAREEGEVRRGRKRKRGDEVDSASEIDEDEVWQALVKSSKEEGGEDVEGSEVEWSDEDVDQELLEEMNGSEDMDLAEMDVDVDDAMSGEEGDVNDFFDDEAEEVDVDDKEESSEEDDVAEAVSEESDAGADDAVSDVGSDASLDGRFDFGDSESDLMDSEDEVSIPAQTSNSNKKRKLKSLPTFASMEEYADLLDD